MGIIATKNNNIDDGKINNVDGKINNVDVVTEKMANVDNVDLSFIDVLPSGGAGMEIIYTILLMLDMKSLSSVIYSSFIQLFCKNRRDDTLYQLCKKIQYPYFNTFLLVCACEKGRLDDVKLLITNYDVNASNSMALKEMVNQVGRISEGNEYTPLMAAAKNEHLHVVQLGIEQCEVDPNIANSNGLNALHYAAEFNRTNTETIKVLLINMSLDSINKKTSLGDTPLDMAYWHNDSRIRGKIIALIRSKGGKANYHSKCGRFVGAGNGDL